MSLQNVWDEVHEVMDKHFPKNNLMPILGGGQTNKPKFMFCFINPTIRNISSHKEWQGPRFPFIGTKQVWRIFHRAGIFDDQLMDIINNSKTWSLEFTDKVQNFLKNNSYYFTNIVKWTGHDATLPNTEKIKLFKPLLEKEIEIVQPEYIIAFGLIPFQHLTGEKIKLSDYYDQTMDSQEPKSYPIQCGSFTAKVIPCYFPVGRGDPKKAVELLKLLKSI